MIILDKYSAQFIQKRWRVIGHALLLKIRHTLLIQLSKNNTRYE